MSRHICWTICSMNEKIPHTAASAETVSGPDRPQRYKDSYKRLLFFLTCSNHNKQTNKQKLAGSPRLLSFWSELSFYLILCSFQWQGVLILPQPEIPLKTKMALAQIESLQSESLNPERDQRHLVERNFSFWPTKNSSLLKTTQYLIKGRFRTDLATQEVLFVCVCVCREPGSAESVKWCDITAHSNQTECWYQLIWIHF